MTPRYTLAIDVLEHHVDYLENDEDIHNNLDMYDTETQTGAEMLAEDIANLNHAIGLLVATDLGEHWLFGKGEEE